MAVTCLRRLLTRWRCGGCDTWNGRKDKRCIACDSPGSRRETAGSTPARTTHDEAEIRMDTWNGKTLVDRKPTSDVEIHYRIYNQATGELLSFGTNGGPGSLNGIVQEALRVQTENPGVRLYTAQFDGPVY
ncbi:hypothetical protein ACIO8F_07810 [Streptomyces sp. NPDC087228]|uniref:hypothetical protein n=1 Tax=Streptomyces sp. NPDC087228 TaxID=3365772 RepID=UPI00382D939C